MTKNILSKTCYVCSKEKPLVKFYKNKGMADGHLNRCISCEKTYKKQYLIDNLSYVREQKKKNRKKNHNSTMESKREWRKNNPIKHTAHMAVSNAIFRGRLVEKPCGVCGEIENVHGHHDDYLKTLEVVWLCPMHHKEWHKENTALNQ